MRWSGSIRKERRKIRRTGRRPLLLPVMVRRVIGIPNTEPVRQMNRPPEETGSYTIAYWLDRPGYSCRAFVFSITGKRVAEISNHQLLGTSGQLTWDGCGSGGTPLAAGVYIFYAEIYHPDGTVKPFKKVFLVR